MFKAQNGVPRVSGNLISAPNGTKSLPHGIGRSKNRNCSEGRREGMEKILSSARLVTATLCNGDFAKSDGERRGEERRGRHAQIDEDRCRLQTLEKEVALLTRRPSTVVESALTDGMEEKRAERGRGGRAGGRATRHRSISFNAFKSSVPA